MRDPRPTLVLVNESAGSVEPGLLRDVCRALQERSRSGVEVRDTGTDEQYAATVATAQGRDVVVVGGDGSVHRLLQELHEGRLLGQVGAVGVVPLGTGNDLARDAAVPLDWRSAVDVALDGTPAPRDLLVDEDGQVVVNVVHCGVAAEATAHAAEVKGLLGRAAYAWGAVRAGLTRRGWHLRVVVDGVPVLDGADRVLMVSVALGSSVGGGTQIAPHVEQRLGVADVVIATGTSPRARAGFALDLLRGCHTERQDVTVTSGREVVVEAVTARDAFAVNVDGDVADARLRRRRWQLHDRAWRMRVPASDGTVDEPQPRRLTT